ncbi:enoyl-CoA hydratase/isomerase family protein [Flavobacterium silvaticum]|uniref:Enoyl-CoA hydratase/isomerase family protein n=1 Tax=Flavobacterium silvaticum TaxID=1852020 RepID=A0A972JI71_9FLAO|nr:enoyl-CoA hydratase/isomerase family protein [Flavobacterium silvaticum]NMH27012.1 enoyl-CoA hydratase/isomerase family protein [Flavobacterium silvaticum]
MPEAGNLQSTITDGVAQIEFFHPSGNSFPAVMLQALTLEFEKLGKDESVKIIVLKSGGDGAFCAGASFDELLTVENIDQGTRFFSGFALVINAMRKCPKLIIGRIQGKTVGGGVGLAAACDYTFATESALVKLSELAIGIGPFVIAPAVERKIGLAAFAELTLCAHEWKSAYWAKEKGLYTCLFKNSDAMDDEIRNFTGILSRYNPEALLELKKIFWQGTEHWESLLYERAAVSGRLVLSDFSRNALGALRK